MNRRCSAFFGIGLCFLLALTHKGHGRTAIGLYKNGQLIDRIGTVTTSEPPIQGAVGVVSKASIQGGNASVIPPETQDRNTICAESSKLGSDIQALLRQMRDMPKSNLAKAVKNPGSATASLVSRNNQLGTLFGQFVVSQDKVRAANEQAGTHVLELGLPQEIFQRHLESMAASENGYILVTNAINDVLLGKTGAVDKALELLDQFNSSEEPDLTKAGPTRIPMQIIPAPEMTREQADALEEKKAGSQPKASSKTALLSLNDARQTIRKSGGPVLFSNPPTGSDLAETVDVQITQAIKDKAAALGNSPLDIYEYVRNNISFQPYLGSRKGSVETLHQKAGNDTDQASLLLALLRAAGIPCRYVRGSVEMTPEQAKSWVGVDDAQTAGSILTTAGLDGLNIVDGSGNVTAIRCTRVWVEAYIPYSNYRGIPNDNAGKTWIPLDPAFKSNNVIQGQDVLTPMGFNTVSFLANYVATPSLTNTSPVEYFEQQVQGWLNANLPGKMVADIERSTTLQAQNLGLLPASFPAQVLSVTSHLSELEDNKRFKVRFRLYDGGTTFIDYTANLTAVAGKRVTIEYQGATTADQATIDAHGGIYQTPPNLVRLKPFLKLDNVLLATSINSIGMGYRHKSDMYFIQPAGDQNQQPVIYNEIYAGNSQAIAFDTFLDSSDPLLDAPSSRTNYFLELLYTSGVDYLRKVDNGMEKVGRIMRAVTVQDVSEAIVESSVSVSYSFGVPQTFQWNGFTVDADRRIVGPFAVNGDSNKKVPYMILTGYDGSAMEHRIFEDTYASPAVSTIRAFHISVSQGISLCYITNSIASACPGFSHNSSVVSAVNSALASGHVVIIPTKSMIYGKWSGTGYIDMDPTTGAAGYIISGGISGSQTAAGGAIVDWLWPIFPPCLAWPWNVTTKIIDPPKDTPDSAAVFSGCDNTVITFTFEVTASCLFGSPTTAPVKRSTHLTKKEIADYYGGGDYTLTMGSLFSTPVTRKITIIKPNLVFKGLEEEIWPNPNEETPGAFIKLNNDDDNNNGHPDNQEIGPVVGEDDLVEFSLYPGVGSLTTGTLTLEATDNPGKIRVFQNKDKSNPVNLPKDWSPSTFPTIPLYLEGKSASSVISDVTLRLRYHSGSIDCGDKVKLTIATAEFAKAPTEDSAGNQYGYDDMDTTKNINDDHISVEKDSSTFLKVKFSGPVGDFTIKSSDSGIAEVNNLPNPMPSEFLLEVIGNGSGEANLEVVPSGGDGPSLASIKVNVYKVLEINKWDVYRITDSGSAGTSPLDSISETMLQNYVNSIVKKGVMHFADVKVTDKDIHYDKNQNGALDWYYDNGSQPEYTEIQNAGLSGNPKIAIVKKVNFCWRLGSASVAGATTITLQGNSGNFINNWTGPSFSYTLGTGSSLESSLVLQSISGNTITLNSPLTKAHAVGESLVSPGGGFSGDPQIILDGVGNYRDAGMLHETLHRIGNLLDVNDSRNIMHWQLGPNHVELRFKPIPRFYASPGGLENQWKTIPRPWF